MKWLLLVAVSAAALGQGIDTRSTAEDYPAHGAAEDITVGAEYHYRSFRAGGQSYFVKDYLVVEAALFGLKPGSVGVSSGQFTLRINGKKSVVSQSPGMIAYRDKWGGPQMTAVGGTGGGVVVLGGPHESRFPGDRRVPPQREPYPRERGKPETGEEADQAELMANTAFPYGELKLPVAGYVYFPYRKKLTSIKRLELIYKGPAGEAVVRLK